jgi:endonuclease/exonuclease/phosphatase family metal-dependent hydrolase
MDGSDTPGSDTSSTVDATRSGLPRPGRRMVNRFVRSAPWLCLLAGVLGLGTDRVGSEPASGTEFRGIGPRFNLLPPAYRPDTCRVVSFNIHSLVGTDGRADVDRTARVLDKAGSGNNRWDFAGLNEVRLEGWPGLGVSQVEGLAMKMNAAWLFAPAERQWWRDHFGNGALTRRPVAHWQRIPLPCTKGKGYRNLLVVEFAPLPMEARSPDDQRGPLRILVVHVDRGADREVQLEIVFRHLLSTMPPVVLMGDLNTRRDDPQLSALLSRPDVVDLVGRTVERDDPERIDWILGRGVTPIEGGIVPNDASDHPAVWSGFRLDTDRGE